MSENTAKSFFGRVLLYRLALYMPWNLLHFSAMRVPCMLCAVTEMVMMETLWANIMQKRLVLCAIVHLSDYVIELFQYTVEHYFFAAS